MYWNGVLKRLDFRAKGSWFIYVTGSILFSLSIYTTKNITNREWMILFSMVGFYGWMANVILFFILDLMDSGDPSIGGVPDIFMFVIGPASMAILFLNQPKKVIRILIFSLISYLIEYCLARLGFLKLKGWKPYYSIPFYLLIFAFVLPWILNIIRNNKK